jgi:hypothetical protein
MFKKMMLLACMATAAISVSASAAQAEGLLKEGGVPLKVGAEVTATSGNLDTLATDLPGQPTLECEKVTIHGTVTSNGTEEATIEENSVTTENCNAVITVSTVGTIHLSAGGTGVGTEATFVADPAPEVSCHFAGNVGFTYTAGSDVLNVPGSTLLGNCGRGDMTGSFTLETEDGTEVTVG